MAAGDLTISLSTRLLPQVFIIIKEPPIGFAEPTPVHTEVTPALTASSKHLSMGFTLSIARR